jgi:hypothetical protein
MNCPNQNHYEIYNQICRFKPCTERNSNESIRNPCGSGCVLNNTEKGIDECKYVCYEIKDENDFIK